MCRCWLLPHTELCPCLLRGGGDTGIQKACHHVLEQKSVTGDSLAMRKRMHYAQTPLSHARALYSMNLYVHTNKDQMSKNDAIICHYVWRWNENTDFGHQYLNGPVNCLQDMSCIIESELLAVWSMSRVILIDRRNSVSRQRNERCCRHVFSPSGCPQEEGSTFQPGPTNAI